MARKLTKDQRHAAGSMLVYLGLYQEWESGTADGVSPALANFFATVDLDAPYALNWARWLRINLEREDCGLPVSVSHANQWVETFTKGLSRQHRHLADQVRRAVSEEQANQLDLL